MKFARAVTAAIGVVAIAAPLLANLLFYASTDRYFWLIRQPGVCSSLGSHVFLFNVGVGAALLAASAIGLLLATHTRGNAVIPLAGVAAGVALVVGASLAAPTLPDPVIASAFGCGG